MKKDKTIIHYPLLPEENFDDIVRIMERIAKRYGYPLEKLEYVYKVYYFKDKRFTAEEGWNGSAEIIYTP